MLKNYLFSPLCSAPFLCSSPLFLLASVLHTSFSFSFFFFSVSAFFLFSFGACLFVQFSATLFIFFFFCFSFLFSSRVALFSAQKHFFQPKTILSSAQNLFQFSPKHFFQKPQHVAPFSSTPLFFCACLLLSFLPTSKAKNILSRCFTFLLFE